MNDDKDLIFSDEANLGDLLACWETPDTPPALDRRVLASYRQMLAERGLVGESPQAESPLASAASVAAGLPAKTEAKMKQCSNCLEEFADKFSFCPVDGTPLNDLGAAAVVSPPPVAPQEITVGALRAATVPATERPAYHLTVLEDTGLTRRLGRELLVIKERSALTWPDFKRDPFGFACSTAGGYGQAAWGVVARPAVALALLTALATVGLAVGAIAVLENRQSAGAGMSKGSVAALAVGALALLGGLLAAWLKRERPAAMTGFGAWGGGRYVESGSSRNDLAAIMASLVFVVLLSGGLYFGSRFMTRRASDAEELVVTDMLENPTEIPKEEEKPKKEEPAGNNKGKGGGSKPKFEKPQGGGGGGDEKETRPVSKGEPPVMSPDPPIVLPKPQPPPERPPLLPVLPTVKGDNALSRTPRSMTFGDPDSSATDPSRGKGTGGGFGGGDGDGAGRGQGNGIGPGRGENTGGGDTRYGGGGPGGGGDGAPPKPPPPAVDRNKAYTAKEVTRKAVITARPEPPYTEEARKNNIVGTVTVRVLLGGNGSVLQVVPLTRLPNGLTEQALAAARRIRFTPAQKENVNVSQWVQVEYSFNLY